MKHKTAFITGATSGIGKATAEIFAKQNIQLILCGRRKDRLISLKTELEKFTKVAILNFDVSNKEEVFKVVQSLPKEFQKIDILINNAGNAHGLSTIQDGSIDDWDAMIDINVKGLLYVSKAILPQMIERNEGLNKAMRLDLNKHNIRVSAIHPGAVETEFSEVRFKGDKEKAKSVYKGFKALQAEDIADIIYFVVTRPYHVNIEDLVVYPTAQASATVLKKEI
jgi:3-hydroxy acid dehydrogenase/malonic semialdehyde reductase